MPTIKITTQQEWDSLPIRQMEEFILFHHDDEISNLWKIEMRKLETMTENPEENPLP